MTTGLHVLVWKAFKGPPVDFLISDWLRTMKQNNQQKNIHKSGKYGFLAHGDHLQISGKPSKLHIATKDIVLKCPLREVGLVLQNLVMLKESMLMEVH